MNRYPICNKIQIISYSSTLHSNATIATMRQQVNHYVYPTIVIILIFYIAAKEYQTIESLVTKNLISSTSTSSNAKVAHNDDDDDDGYDDNDDGQKTPTKILTFHRSNPHSRSWCPNAKCYNSPQCTPCQRRYLFLLTTGRSGSTTLLEMFDQLPNVRLSGENYNVVFQTYDLLKRLHDSKHFNKDEYSNNETIVEEDYFFMNKGVKYGAFKHHPIPIGSFACVVQHFANALNPPEYELQSREDNRETIAHIKNDEGILDGHDDDNTIHIGILRRRVS